MNNLLMSSHAHTSRLVTAGPGVVRVEWKNEHGEVIVMITMSTAEAEDAAAELQAAVGASKSNSDQRGRPQ